MAVVKPLPVYFFDDAGAHILDERGDLGDWMRREDVEQAFQPGVAYMLVPRCDACKHWEREEEGHWDAHPCKLLSRDFCCSGRLVKRADGGLEHQPPDFPAGATGGGGVETRPDFGCVQYEARDQ